MDVKQRRWLVACSLLAYSAILVKFVVFKSIPTIHIGHLKFRFGGTRRGPANLTPFKTLWPLFTGRGNHLIAMVNLLGNIVPFIPLGVLAPLVYRRMNWQSSVVLAIAVGLAMEAMEVVFRVGIFDVDDILLNALGVMIGFWVFTLAEARGPHRIRPA